MSLEEVAGPPNKRLKLTEGAAVQAQAEMTLLQTNEKCAHIHRPVGTNRVEDLHALEKVLREEDCNVFEKFDESELGKFTLVIDPEGNKVELLQLPAGQ